jgi:hypothetical protein
MKLMNNIKVFMGRRVLENHLKDHMRIPAVCNIDYAQHIGIIYNATENVSFEIIRNLVKDISHDSRKVTVLGYVDSKKLIDNYLYRKGFDFFSKSELNWYSKPVSSVVEEFIKEPFDLLINLSLKDYYPIRYIVALSPASFKVGKFDVNDLYLDFMIDIEREKQNMKSLHYEIMKDTDITQQHENSDLENDIERKTETELQLSFLINQLLHYLSILKK